MTKYLKIFGAVMMIVSGALSLSYYFTHKVSYESTFIGLIGLLILYPAVTGYIKMFDNLFGK